ncbi:hypothetical protein CR513_13035, partial [Mucuna pruriens]
MEEKKIKEDVDVDVAKDEDREVVEEIMTTFIIVKRVINSPKVMEKEEANLVGDKEESEESTLLLALKEDSDDKSL